MNRLLVVGPSGSGKTTLASEISARLGIPHIELDALHHGPGWVPRPTFVDDVDTSTRATSWVVDGTYAGVRELLWSRASAIVWIDLPRILTEWRVVRRSFIRWVRHTELWNGCHEPSPLGWFHPEHPVTMTWTKHAEYRERYAGRFADSTWAPHIKRVRLESPEAVRAFREGL